jgi:hypothetical protein
MSYRHYTVGKALCGDWMRGDAHGEVVYIPNAANSLIVLNPSVVLGVQAVNGGDRVPFFA